MVNWKIQISEVTGPEKETDSAQWARDFEREPACSKYEIFSVCRRTGALLISVAYHEDVIELIHIVNALSEQLALHLIGDLVHTVSPVGHNAFFFLFSLSE